VAEPAGDAEEVARVEELALRPPGRELVALKADLDLPGAVEEGREEELAEVARLEHAAGDREGLADEGSGLLGRARARDEVRDRPRDDAARRVGIDARRAQGCNLGDAVGLGELGHPRERTGAGGREERMARFVL
jgi:hypothetical protein